jgi:hypothetical protein
MPSKDILRQIYRIPTYMESYTPTRLDIRCSLINLIINYFHYLITSFHFLLYTTRALPHRTLWYQNPLLTEKFLQNACRQESGGKSRSDCKSLSRTTKAKLVSSLHTDHRQQKLDPQGPRIRTCGRVGLTSQYSPRARPWCARASAMPRGSPVWLLALPISAGRW